jgi:hypothetical protein
LDRFKSFFTLAAFSTIQAAGGYLCCLPVTLLNSVPVVSALSSTAGTSFFSSPLCLTHEEPFPAESTLPLFGMISVATPRHLIEAVTLTPLSLMIFPHPLYCLCDPPGHSTLGELFAWNKLAAAFPLSMRITGPLSFRKSLALLLLPF